VDVEVAEIGVAETAASYAGNVGGGGRRVPRNEDEQASRRDDSPGRDDRHLVLYRRGAKGERA